ncbi:hypothetical protein G7085_20015 [Tessaracoccus sp. HDW20]|nr:hypothetical protein [Tessaracoccus coleopterorum]
MLFGRVLGAWSYLVMVVGVAYAFNLRFLWALGFTLTGWLLVQLASRLLQRPLNQVFSTSGRSQPAAPPCSRPATSSRGRPSSPSRCATR